MVMLIAFLKNVVTFIYTRCTLITNQTLMTKICNFNVLFLCLFILLLKRGEAGVLRLVPCDRRDTRDLF